MKERIQKLRKTLGTVYREIFGGVFLLAGLAVSVGMNVYNTHQKEKTPEGQAYTECVEKADLHKGQVPAKFCAPEKYVTALQFQKASASRSYAAGEIQLMLMLIGASFYRTKRSNAEHRKEYNGLFDRHVDLQIKHDDLARDNEKMKRELDGRAETERKRQQQATLAEKEAVAEKASKGAAVLKEDIVIGPPVRIKKSGNNGPT